jgi:hypothetical protein
MVRTLPETGFIAIPVHGSVGFNAPVPFAVYWIDQVGLNEIEAFGYI